MNWLSLIFGNKKRNIVSGQAYTSRQGKFVPIDDAYEAWTSGCLDDMIKASNSKTNLIDRHFLLQSIVSESYKLREDEKYRTTCIEFAEKHLAEFSQIAPALRKEMGGVLPRISTFQEYATVLTENGDFEKAITVCNMALSYGLQDGTKSGYIGRIKRIADKMEKAK